MTLENIITARGGKVQINKGDDGKWKTNIWDIYGWYIVDNDIVNGMIDTISEKNKAKVDITEMVKELVTIYPNPADIGHPMYKGKKPTIAIPSAPKISVAPSIPSTPSAPSASKSYTEEEFKATKAEIETAFQKVWDFFSEFNIRPKDRMLDTLSHCPTLERAKMYVSGYFALSNHPDRNSISEKVKSDEFKMVWRNIHKYECSDWVNKRLEIFWGEPSGGKSTEARKRYPNAKRFKVGPSMTDDELIQVFDFTDECGKPHFYNSVLVDAMINGEPIIIDEINHLRYETLVGMQDFLDNTDTFVTSRKEEVTIKEGFKIIGTMNLDIDGTTFALPEAIVDRCYNIEEFETTPALLADRFTKRFYERG